MLTRAVARAALTCRPAMTRGAVRATLRGSVVPTSTSISAVRGFAVSYPRMVSDGGDEMRVGLMR